MQLSLECEFHFGSCTSGRPRRIDTVYSRTPWVRVSGRAVLYSGMITMVGGVIVNRGSWYGVDLTPRVTISRMWTPSASPMPLASSVAWSMPVSSSGVRPMSMSIPFAPSKSRRRCSSRNAMPSVVDADALPDTVTEHEAAVEDRDDRLLAREQVVVDPDDDRRVARIDVVVVGAVRHQRTSRRLAAADSGVRSRCRLASNS